MTMSDQNVTRRTFLAGGVAAGALLVGHELARPASAASNALIAVSVPQAPTEPDDPAWGQAAALDVQLLPQAMVVPRVVEAGAKAIGVRALYDADRLAILLEWKDAHPDEDVGTVMNYRDGAAVQFPEDPSLPTPSFTMGALGNACTIYHWKSDWQFGREFDVDEAYPNMYADWYAFSGVAAGEIPEADDYLTKGRKEYLTAAAVGNALADPRIQETVGPVQKMRGEGFGTIEPHRTQDANGKGVWKDGVWRIAVSVPRRQERFTFSENAPYNVAFAVWDGSRNERNGQKAYSVWQALALGSLPSPGATGRSQGSSVPIIGGVAGAAAAALAGLAALLRFRQRRQGQEPPSGPA